MSTPTRFLDRHHVELSWAWGRVAELAPPKDAWEYVGTRRYGGHWGHYFHRGEEARLCITARDGFASYENKREKNGASGSFPVINDAHTSPT